MKTQAYSANGGAKRAFNMLAFSKQAKKQAIQYLNSIESQMLCWISVGK